MGNVGVPSNQPLESRLWEELFIQVGIVGAAAAASATERVMDGIAKANSNMNN